MRRFLFLLGLALTGGVAAASTLTAEPAFAGCQGSGS